MVGLRRRSSQFLWRVLRARRVSVLFPLLLNVVVAMGLAFGLRRAITANWSISLTTLSAAAGFFIVLGLQQMMLRLLYSGSLVTYMAKTRERHAVTMTFGAEILSRFLSDGFTPDLVRGVESLPWLLERLEEGDHPLSLVSYAMLLDKAAEMEPDRILAVWNFSVVPISEVFNSSGEVTSDYRTYFQTLKRMYRRIASPDAKPRLFIFEDALGRQKTESHAGWPSLHTYMRD